MIDVHPPEHGIHGVRDFLLHLLTITVGLLIAIGLEASVEGMHHRAERKEAEATLRQELTQNRRTLVGIQKNRDREREELAKILMFLKDLREGKKDDESLLRLTINVEPLQSAGWRTASVTGALSYMKYDEVQRFSAAYQEQQLFEDAKAKALGDAELLFTYLREPAPLAMKAQDIDREIGDVRQLIADLGNMSDTTRATLGIYDEALKQ